MKFGSVCSGIEAASVAWHSLGWKAAWFSEIEPFPCAALSHHYPDVPNHGDMTTLPDRIRSGEVEAPDVFCGGTPCQAFSVAGKRDSLADARGNLSLTFCEIANAIDYIRHDRSEQPCIVFWENVPGVLSTNDNAFGCFLAQLCGGDEPLHAPDGWPNAGCVSGPRRTAAWRILDAQYFGLAQRRRRVFVVASARAGFDPAAVLFEFDGVRRDTAPSREAGQKPAPTIAGCANGGGANGPGRDVDSVESLICISSGQANAEVRTDGGAPALTCLHEAPIVAHSLRGEGFDASEDGTGRGTPLVPVAYPLDLRNALRDPNKQDEQNRQGVGTGEDGDPAPTLTKAHVHGVAVAWTSDGVVADPITASEGKTYTNEGANFRLHNCVQQPVAIGLDEEQNAHIDGFGTLKARMEAGGFQGAVMTPAMQVRRLTPVECERLQGFPDNYTQIPWRKKPAGECPDGPRYKALGNSWAVPVVRWIGERINNYIKETA
jgi:DNA (cytosine-5)-methyltransferase 1